MTSLAIIPGKGHSRGLPGKNLKELYGMSLIEWAVHVASMAGCFDRIAVTSESPAVREHAKLAGAEAIDRPPSLSNHNVHAVAPTLDAAKQMGLADSDIVTMLLPTFPYRMPEELVKATTLVSERKYDAVVGIAKSKIPINSFRWKNDIGEICPVFAAPLLFQRDEVEPIFHVNGSIFTTTYRILRKQKMFHVANCYGLETEYNIDINNIEDWDRAVENAFDVWKLLKMEDVKR